MYSCLAVSTDFRTVAHNFGFQKTMNEWLTSGVCNSEFTQGLIFQTVCFQLAVLENLCGTQGTEAHYSKMHHGYWNHSSNHFPQYNYSVQEENPLRWQQQSAYGVGERMLEAVDRKVTHKMR